MFDKYTSNPNISNFIRSSLYTIDKFYGWVCSKLQLNHIDSATKAIGSDIVEEKKLEANTDELQSFSENTRSFSSVVDEMIEKARASADESEENENDEEWEDEDDVELYAEELQSLDFSTNEGDENSTLEDFLNLGTMMVLDDAGSSSSEEESDDASEANSDREFDPIAYAMKFGINPFAEHMPFKCGSGIKSLEEGSSFTEKVDFVNKIMGDSSVVESY